jgi:hypothetical protein
MIFVGLLLEIERRANASMADAVEFVLGYAKVAP